MAADVSRPHAGGSDLGRSEHGGHRWFSLLSTSRSREVKVRRVCREPVTVLGRSSAEKGLSTCFEARDPCRVVGGHVECIERTAVAKSRHCFRIPRSSSPHIRPFFTTKAIGRGMAGLSIRTDSRDTTARGGRSAGGQAPFHVCSAFLRASSRPDTKRLSIMATARKGAILVVDDEETASDSRNHSCRKAMRSARVVWREGLDLAGRFRSTRRSSTHAAGE